MMHCRYKRVIPVLGIFFFLLFLGSPNGLAQLSSQELIQDLEKAKADLSRLQKQRAETEREVERKRREEQQLKAKISNLERIVRGRNDELSIYYWNLEKEFPRRRQNLQNRQEGLLAEKEIINSLVTTLINNSLASQAERGTVRSHWASVSGSLLRQNLSGLLERKQVIRKELDDIQAQLDEIDRKTELDYILIERAQRRIEEVEQNRTVVSGQLEESARLRKQAQDEAKRIADRIKALQALIARIHEQPPPVKEGPPARDFAGQKGRLQWPVSGKVLNRFGQRKHPQFNLTIDNQGIDIEGSPGQEIRAAAEGHVVYSGTLPGYGSLLMIDHGGDYFTFYTPAVEAAVQTGQRVEKGQVIARLAEAQGGTPGALHFEIRLGEKALNPLDWLSPNP